jgi:hypothetical protein
MIFAEDVKDVEWRNFFFLSLPLSLSLLFCLGSYFETGSHCVAQAGLKLTNILLPQPPTWWSYR